MTEDRAKFTERLGLAAWSLEIWEENGKIEMAGALDGNVGATMHDRG